MNESESNPSQADFAEQVAGLQRQIFALLLALVVLSGTLVVFLYYQSHILDKDLTNLRAQSQPIINWVAQNQAGVEKFKMDLVNYSKAHPEFLPVLEKYGYVPTATKPVTTALPPKK